MDTTGESDRPESRLKPWYASKTIWANVALILAALQQQLPILQDYIDPKTYVWVLFFAGFLNIGLRAITSNGISR